MRGLHWFRNDLRLRDNTALARASRECDTLLCVFVLDPRLLEPAQSATPRSRFLLDCLERLAADLRARDQRLVVRRGRPEDVIPTLLAESRAEVVSWNRDTTPFARRRDDAVAAAAETLGVRVRTPADRVIFEATQVRTQAGGFYSVYGPFRRAWLARWRREPAHPAPLPRLPAPVEGVDAGRLPAWPGAPGTPELPTGGEDAALRRLDRFLSSRAGVYDADRERPAVDGTSRLSHHLRFGTLSVRQCLEHAEAARRQDRSLRPGVGRWIEQLVWREFYAGVLQVNPHVLTRSFRGDYDRVRWDDAPEAFAAWCEGRTGYPFVDAAMRQLRATGWMHNRARMVVASFLTKDLLIDWRRGERFFFERLVDGDPANNNGGWQWAASTGTDPQPYFRIFNPVKQGERFDPDGDYVRRFVPELEKLDASKIHRPWACGGAPGYPDPIVDHAERRKEALARYGEARQGGSR